jgi:hypothetical protein
MNLRITATYPATDGSMPESVEVEFTDTAPADADLTQTVLGMLLRAPANREAKRKVTQYGGLLVEKAAKGSLLGLLPDGTIRRVILAPASEEFVVVGPASSSMEAGTSLRMDARKVWGVWSRS